MKRHVPITLEGPYIKRTSRVTRARRTWYAALVAVATALLWYALPYFMG